MFNFKKAVQVFVIAGSSAAFSGPAEDYFHAVEVDAANVVGDLLARGLDPNSRDANGQTALVLALRGDASATTKLLVAHERVDVNLANASGETPLMMAALRGNAEVARVLLGRGAQVNRAGWTPLHYAASGPSTELVALLLDRGAAIDAPSPNGTTPLMMAARYGSIDSADLLHKRGASLRIQNERGLDAAEFARGAGRESLAQRLTAR